MSESSTLTSRPQLNKRFLRPQPASPQRAPPASPSRVAGVLKLTASSRKGVYKLTSSSKRGARRMTAEGKRLIRSATLHVRSLGDEQGAASMYVVKNRESKFKCRRRK